MLSNSPKTLSENTRIVDAAEAFNIESEAILQGRRAARSDVENDRPKVGLALSGGGIRSATFCLGVLQAFAKRDKLVEVDYLSTVSGGGYIGSWLSAWIHRKGLPFVNNALKSQTPRSDGYIEAPEVTWLRQYSNYLAPQLGFLSADSMTLVATWVRNVTLNLIILGSFLALCFLAPRLLLSPTVYAMDHLRQAVGGAASWIGFFLFPLGISFQLSRAMSQDHDGHVELMNTTWGVLLLVVIPGLFTALLGSVSLFSQATTFADLLQVAKFALMLLILSGIFWFGYRLYVRGEVGSTIHEAVVFLVAFAVSILVGTLMIKMFSQLLEEAGTSSLSKAAGLLSFGPPAILVTFGTVGSIIVGLVGRAYYERTREWWSRMNAWFIILGVIWLALFSLTFYSAPFVLWAYEQSGWWISSLVGVGWVGSLVSTLLAPRAHTVDQSLLSRFRSVLLNAALLFVVAGLLLSVAAGTGLLLERVGENRGGPSAPTMQLQRQENGAKKLTPVQLEVSAIPDKPTVVSLVPKRRDLKTFPEVLQDSFVRQNLALGTCVDWHTFKPNAKPDASACATGSLDFSFLFTAVCLVTLVIFGIRVDVNKFSLHNLYKNRLIRCYLGASRYDDRRPHPFTGFDENDDLPLTALQTAGQKNNVPVRPVHILNAAINITHGSNLAWQERKAASFTFTPWHCGFVLGPSTGDAQTAASLSAEPKKTGGYRQASEWASHGDEQKSFSLGMAMATSGAAVSSISGKSSKPALAFLLTIFNARLGRWSPNPLWRQGWRRASPTFGLLLLLQELFGYSTEVSNFVYLSDGGHFDNSGVYELVRRRCKTIVAVDATADVERGMDDLANLIRKCRVDFGARIDFDLQQLGTSRADQSSSHGFVVGTIDYGSQGGKELKGTLVVIKPTLIAMKELGVDVFGYSRKSDSFPHQSTVDQFFSESQFESYRELGERIASACLKHPHFPKLR